MSDRKAVLLLMFDLPAVTSEDHKEYQHFMKALRQNGFLRLQESCYLKLIRNVSSVNTAIETIKKKLPKQGNVSILPLNLNEFAGMRCLCGEPFDMELFTEDVYVIGDGADG